MIDMKYDLEKMMGIRELRSDFDAVLIYRGILKEPVIKKLYKLIKYLSHDDGNVYGFLRHYSKFYFELNKFGLKSLKEYIIDRILYDENSFAELSIGDNIIDDCIINAVKHDLTCISHIAAINAQDLINIALGVYKNLSEHEEKLICSLGDWYVGEARNDELSKYTYLTEVFSNETSWGEKYDRLMKWYSTNGGGKFGRCKGFVWKNKYNEKELIGIASPDSVSLSDLIGYERERELILNNTRCFLQGLPANNVLLYGDRGTGKSATIKALLNEYADQGLRVIELAKEYLNDLPTIIRLVKNKRQKFIIFIDDLTFSDNEDSYSALKAALEGGLECRTSNVIIYATSNRRHLVKEKFSDRVGFGSDNSDDEIMSADTIQEKLSLADRFGITITYSSPDKGTYLKIVEGLARKRNIDIDVETLKQEAVKWEIRYNGRSARTAKQFIDYIEGCVGVKLI